MIRLGEFALSTMLSSPETRLGLVFHTEGLVNPKIARTMIEFGRSMKGAFRPMIAVITPLCPQYGVNPLTDPLRTDFSPRLVTQKQEISFRDLLGELAEYYDVGYHGHFFAESEGRFKPSFEAAVIRDQFRQELGYLKGLGFSPKTYAGGWWFISEAVVDMLRESGFYCDTTLNDVGADSFGVKQPFGSFQVGKPGWLTSGVVELPSVRSFSALRSSVVRMRRAQKLVVLALHDYDLTPTRTRRVISGLIRRAVNRDRALPIPEMIELSLKMLGESARSARQA